MALSSVFVIVGFAALLGLEEWMRSVPASGPAWDRLATNWGLGAINFGLAALLPMATYLAAFWPGQGLLATWPVPVAFLALLLVRSFVAYWLHRSLHAVPWLWRMHRVHHADTLIDCSTGLRNHPVESLIAAALASATVIALGASPEVVAAVNALLLLASFWHHAAIRLPLRLSGALEWLVVTPRLHLVHHSQAQADHDRNFGDIVSVWDRLFGSFAPPRMDPIRVGLADEGQVAQSLRHQLAAPFAHNK